MRTRNTYIVILMVMSTSFIAQQLYGQIGGQFSPLQHSVHTYSIVMGDANFIPVWGIYETGTTASAIENNLAVAVTGFVVNDDYVSGGIAYYVVQFSVGLTPMAENDYVIAYKETTNDSRLCLIAVTKDIHLYGAFDVDIALNVGELDLNCADESGDLKETDLTSTTTVEYKVWVEFPDGAGYIETGGDNRWSFLFTVKSEGVSGNNAPISSITLAAADLAPIPTYDLSAEPSSFTGSCPVSPSSVTPLIFTVVYKDVLGESQDVSFEIKSILGAYEEPDVDEVNNTLPGNNIVTHTIYAMPDVGTITPLN